MRRGVWSMIPPAVQGLELVASHPDPALGARLRFALTNRQAGTSVRSSGVQLDEPKLHNTSPRMACLLVGDC